MEALLIVLVGAIAGVINAVAGAGTIVTFPVLVALGYPPVVANASNLVALVPAAVTGAWGFRRELSGHWPRVGLMAAFSGVGGVLGAVLLIALPATAFSLVVPFLLVLTALLAAVQPLVARAIRGRARATRTNTVLTLVLFVSVFITGVYGGYFGAAQGVILLALLGILWTPDMIRANGAKNVLAGVAGLTSSFALLFSGLIDWYVVLLLGGGAAFGGWVGARVGRRLPATLLRAVLVLVAIIAAIVFALRG